MKKLFSICVALAMAVLLVSTVQAARNIGTTYRTASEVYGAMNNLMYAHPDLISRVTIGTDAKGGSIYMYKIGTNTNWQFMFDGRMHGPEDCGTETGYKFVQWVATSSDSRAAGIRANSQLLFIPVVNNMPSRQNAKRTTSTPVGVDLNRNFPTQWTTAISSNKWDNQNFRGTYASSEPETRAILGALSTYEPHAYLNSHCGMEGLWAVNTDTTTQKLLSKMKSISYESGALTNTKYNPKIGSLGDKGGYAVLTAAKSYGSSAWLFEISKWENLPSTLTGYHDKWYKHAFPVYLALSRRPA